MSADDTDTDPAARVAELESTVERLEERLDHHYEILATLVASVDAEALPEMECPYCETGTVTTESGVTWERVQCTHCDFAEYLRR